MKVIVCGAGQVGWQIARHLSSENNDVIVVDQDAALVRRITDTLDVAGVTGYASHPDVLERAGARDADMIIAATFSDEVNMIACQVAHSVFTVPRKIARVRAQSYLDPEWTDIYRQDHMPIDVIISPEKEVAEAALRRLSAPAAFEIQGFLDNSVQLVGLMLDEDCPVLNTPLRQLTELFSTLRAYVVSIRSENGELRVADSDDQLFAGDQIYVFVANSDLDRTLEIFGKTTQQGNRALILGAGNVGLGVASQLEQGQRRSRVKLIERDRNRAEAVADTLERTIVLNGDGLSIELLEEAGIRNIDSFLAVTDDDKTNLLSCARAKSLGAKLTVCLINDPSLAPLMQPLGIDAYINPRSTTVSSILRHVRHGRIRAVYSIGDAEAEVIEAQVLSTSSIAGKRVRNTHLPEGAIIGAVQKGSQTVIPRAETVIEEGDSITIFAMREQVPEVEKLFRVSIDFF
ncbi:Trk system potassium transporter TrkA [Pontivivens insulae]|uniref:Trk system potassium uptake protein TrkA n=1 Tax=Pontivivens insulae TaxID=1639689 RepID=A0A2R8AAW2_9RHOB|nr:Trk system potassium transporter TrkA [Pontivivens insulae]RED13280.1 trk system potassium uptake protein TrkA [Pontivivens insulae]SPF29372.1 Trk system potassium uptake protein TrkA [Pontivivens insulae]